MTFDDLMAAPAVYTTAASCPPVTVDGLLAVMRAAPPPPPDEVIVTPSLEALEAEFGAARADGPCSPFTGIPVFVSKFVDRPRLVPRAWLRSHHHAGG